MLTCQVKELGHPIDADAEHFHLVAPYSADSRQWKKMKWIDQYSGERFAITTDGHHGGHKIALVRSYRDVLRAYEFHPESKCADADGNVCGKQTGGLLQRRHVEIDRARFIGKESNALEAVEAGLVHSANGVYTEYCDRARDEWQVKILPALKKAPLAVLFKETGLSRRTLIELRAGRCRPHSKNPDLVKMQLIKLGFL